MSRRVNLQRWGTWAWFQLCMNAFYHMPVIFALAFYEENIAPFFSPPFFFKSEIQNYNFNESKVSTHFHIKICAMIGLVQHSSSKFYFFTLIHFTWFPFTAFIYASPTFRWNCLSPPERERKKKKKRGEGEKYVFAWGELTY